MPSGKGGGSLVNDDADNKCIATLYNRNLRDGSADNAVAGMYGNCYG